MLLITGANGQLSNDLKKVFSNAIFASKAELDITNNYDVRKFCELNNISKIINCAAYTYVDGPELNSKNAELCYKVNTEAVKNLVSTKIPMIHISTDYVFDGKKSSPYSELDATNPINIYGKSKVLGEEYILEHSNNSLIVRVSGLYNATHKNFVTTIYKLLQIKSEINVVNDQFMTLTYSDDLVEFLKILENSNKNGIYHYSNLGISTWFDVASKIAEFSNSKCNINPINAVDYNAAANRPLYSILDKSKIMNQFDITIPLWYDSLKKCVDIIRKNK
jgi:dTDP-4-dehydrorhamnose reductase